MWRAWRRISGEADAWAARPQSGREESCDYGHQVDNVEFYDVTGLGDDVLAGEGARVRECDGNP